MKKVEYLHFSGYISGALQLAPDTSREGRRRRRAFHWRARPTQISVARWGRSSSVAEARAATREGLLETRIVRVRDGAFPCGSLRPISAEMRAGGLC